MTGGGRAAALDPRSAVVLLVCGIVAVMVAMGALRVGAYPFGTSWPDDATSCQAAEEEVGSRDPPLVDQDTPSWAKRTWLPPGVICSVDVRRDGRPEVTRH